MDKTDPEKDDVGPLPRWDLARLMLGVASEDAPEAVEKSFAALERQCARFTASYKGRVGRLSGEDLGAAIAAYESLSEKAGVLYTYFRMCEAQDVTARSDARARLARLKEITRSVDFFTDDLRAMKEADLLSRLSAPALGRYSAFLGKVRREKEDSADTALAHYVAEKEKVSFDAWRTLLEDEKRAITVRTGGKTISLRTAFTRAARSKTPAERAEYYAAAMRGLSENAEFFTLATNTLVELHHLRDARQGFARAPDFRHHKNAVDGDVIEAMVRDIRDNYSRLSHRYYAWKAQKEGAARLHPAERNSGIDARASTVVAWEDAKETILAAFAKFSPEMEKSARAFFDGGYIDAQAGNGKRAGAFSNRATPSTHPLILMSFTGTTSNMRTLAHELGHGVHQKMTAKNGYLMQDTPLILSETASTFAEGLLYRHLIETEQDPVKKRALIAERVENMMNMALVQTAVYTFETRLHAEAAEKGPLEPARVSAIWLETQKECFGYPVDFGVKGAENEWMMRHRIRRPFYSYAYAFGECLSAALLDQYDKAKDKDAFVKKYDQFLQGSATKPLESLLDIFDLDTQANPFWRRGLAAIASEMEALFALDRQIEAQKAPPAADKKGPRP